MTTPRPSGTPAVHMQHIEKRFGAVHANRDVNLRVAAGTVHGIVGENGAGKSTLMSILYGFYQADSGQIEVEGQPARITGSAQAIALGIGMVHQHFMLVDTLSALDNIMLGAEPGWLLNAARAQVRARLEVLMQGTGLRVDLDALVADLPVGERQRLEILKALFRGARILILDEPTAVLTPQETEALFVTLRQLRAQGTTILLITHKLKEIMALCDAVTVMRAGAVVLDCAVADTSVDGLAEAMVGRRVQMGRGEGHAAATPGAVLLQARGLGWTDALGVPRLADVSLALHAGEIVGIAGVSGNGQSELLDVLSGLLTPAQGELTAGSQHFTPAHWMSTRQARALHIAHVPEDRHRRGMVLGFEAWETAVLGYEARPRYSLGGWMRQRAMREDTAAMMERYDVRPRNATLRSAKFSGGNQQKLVLAREAAPSPKVLLVGQPTRGVDIGAIEFIHGRLRAMRDAGGAVLVVSSELDEILALADRVIVMNAGRIAGELPIAACSESALGRLMGGAHEMSQPVELPRWIDVAVLPAVNLAMALLVAGLVVLVVGFDPAQVISLLIKGAFGSQAGLSYTLYYATTFVFTGLAVAVAFHGGVFNIGGEGQAIMGGLGAGLAALAFGAVLPAALMLPLMVLAAAVFGMVWGAVPGALQAWRGSHTVITTIMFNFIAAALLSYLLVGVLKEPGNMTPESRAFADSARMPGMHEALGWLGVTWPRTPLNLSVLLAVAAAVLVYLGLWKTRAGYALRAVGFAPDAALYAGMSPKWLITGAMAASGALAGLVGVNEIAGVHGRLLADFVAGAGFAGIAVCLIGRNHPVGIVLASLLFGALYQGGAELAFEINGFSRDMVFMLQGLVVLFAGAMARVAAPTLARLWRMVSRPSGNAGAAHG